MRVSKIQEIASLSLAMTIVILYAMTSMAQTCAYQDGGYCLSEIAHQTAGKVEFAIAKVETMVMPMGKTAEGIEGGTAYLNFYENMWDQMVQKGTATQSEREVAFAEARKAGGTKIGGVNLVVLSAATLQQLIDKNLITKEEAQSILNNAKKGE